MWAGVLEPEGAGPQRVRIASLSWMTNSVAGRTAAPAGGKRERLVGAACDLVYRQGAERTTLADIARAADVPLGNVYYYFKTKDDIFAAVLQARVDELESGFATLEDADPSPQARLKALVEIVTEQAQVFARWLPVRKSVLRTRPTRRSGTATGCPAHAASARLDRTAVPRHGAA